MRQTGGALRQSRNQSLMDDSMSSTIERATLQDEVASRKENYHEAIRERSSERLHLKAEEHELQEDLQKLVDRTKKPMTDEAEPPQDQSDEVRQLKEIKANYEMELEKYAQHIIQFKETILQLREENGTLRDQLRQLKSNNHGKVIKDLEEEISKWETLYYESADVGAARMSRLEDELEHLRTSSKSNQKTADTAKEDMETLCNALKATFASAREKQLELRAFKHKSKQRVSVLEDMLEKATIEKTDRERELQELKNKEQQENQLLEKIDDLKAEVRAKSAIIERERNQATKREARLKNHLRKVQRSSKINTTKNEDEALDSGINVFTKFLEESISWCVPTEPELDMPKSPRIQTKGLDRGASLSL